MTREEPAKGFVLVPAQIRERKTWLDELKPKKKVSIAKTTTSVGAAKLESKVCD